MEVSKQTHTRIQAWRTPRIIVPPLTDMLLFLPLANINQQGTRWRKIKWWWRAFRDSWSTNAIRHWIRRSSGCHGCYHKVRKEEYGRKDGTPRREDWPVSLSCVLQVEMTDWLAGPLFMDRYFGGIKLGAGGLVRAYGGVTRNCLRNAETIIHIPKVMLQVRAPLSMAGQVFQVRAHTTLQQTLFIVSPQSAKALVVEIHYIGGRLGSFWPYIQEFVM